MSSEQQYFLNFVIIFKLTGFYRSFFFVAGSGRAYIGKCSDDASILRLLSINYSFAATDDFYLLDSGTSVPSVLFPVPVTTLTGDCNYAQCFIIFDFICLENFRFVDLFFRCIKKICMSSSDLFCVTYHGSTFFRFFTCNSFPTEVIM